mgnify:CR=1 FL=1
MTAIALANAIVILNDIGIGNRNGKANDSVAIWKPSRANHLRSCVGQMYANSD